jgi:hypothetical protein
VRQNLYVVGIAMENLVHLMDAVMMDVLQNLDVLNLDEVRPFLVVVRHFQSFLADVPVDAEPNHQLRKDYFRDEEGVGQRHLLN